MVSDQAGYPGAAGPRRTGRAIAYMICQPSEHYYKVMTGSDRMPVFIDQTI